ncbi:MAG: TetR/AcrR family transcriptional regulator [Gordonia paraffinivorans]
MARRGETRRRMVHSAIGLMQRRGAAAVTVDAVLADSGAPRGSVYHHFPGGRDEIVAAALQASGDVIGAMLTSPGHRGPAELLDLFVDFWTRQLLDSDFTAGCPVVGAAVSGPEVDPHLAELVADIFATWHRTLAAALTESGVDETRARTLASTAIAAVEGALLLSRSQRSMDPLHDVAGELRTMVEAAIPA